MDRATQPERSAFDKVRNRLRINRECASVYGLLVFLLCAACGLAPELGKAVTLPAYTTAADLESHLGAPCSVEQGGGEEAWIYCAKRCAGQWCRSTCDGECTGHWRFLLVGGVIVHIEDPTP